MFEWKRLRGAWEHFAYEVRMELDEARVKIAEAKLAAIATTKEGTEP